MERQFMTVCVFCLLCTTHSHCSSHGNVHSSHSTTKSNYNTYNDGGGVLQLTDLLIESSTKQESVTENDKLDASSFISQIFEMYGDGKTISQEGFEKLLRNISLGYLIDHHYHSHILHGDLNSSKNDNTTGSFDNVKTLPPSLSCVTSDNLLGAKEELSKELFKAICPILLYQYLPNSTPGCLYSAADHSKVPLEQTKNLYSVWMYATLSIVVISLCGLGGVIVIPVMEKVFYQKLLQFLVALAVGTLCGDALLHLLPHAMLPRNSYTRSTSHPHGHLHSFEMADNHDTNMWLGLVAVFGVIFLYFTEKGLTYIADWRKRKQRKKQALPRVRVMREPEAAGLVSKTAVGEKLCKHKYSSYPYCYGEITDNAETQKIANESKDGLDVKNINDKVGKEENGLASTRQYTYTKDKANGADPAVERELLNPEKELNDLSESHGNEESYTIIIREHESAHHGHSHQHGHVHAAPTSISSVAWMVVMGDGLHNFADGMAIGAAFATNISGGFSTALAIFFHELPHELGDFAVLLQAGMSAKQAVFYNLLSSILCFVGMCLGVFLGHNETTTQWVFSAAAGMFLYIALVDMIPELTSSHSKEGSSFCQCALHFAGLMSGVGTMLLIALYEHDLESVFVE
ncbi:solute carrier family 39 fear-of-intimacy [Lycorma delicatula]|uniref:solute carrier family 39 fear-of-intimacy n=1 Tax=Lycorma delicatula TaxID=130591 RepID=UPI003F51A13D